MKNSPIPINENYETYNQISDNIGIIENSMYSGDNQEQESFPAAMSFLRCETIII